MTHSLRYYEAARAEVACLLPLRDELSRNVGRLKLRLRASGASESDALYERVLRCERVLGQLDARIRIAADFLSGRLNAPLHVEPSPAAPRATGRTAL